MNDLVTMAVLDGTDDLLEEPTSFVLGHLRRKGWREGKGAGSGRASDEAETKEGRSSTNLSFLREEKNEEDEGRSG